MGGRWLLLCCSAVLSACSASVMDRHHFATVDPSNDQIVNIFRVTVRGNAQVANARYISGFYDERAVDLFFNEVRSTALPIDLQASAVEPIFRTVNCSNMTAEQCTAEQNRHLRTVPIGGNPEQRGAFVMILSTSADAIAGTIGAFAENDVVLNSVMYLATRSDREDAAAVSARSTIDANMRAATMNELNTLITTAASAPADAREAVYRQMLSSVAAGLMPGRPPRFENIEQARAWFAARPWVEEE